MISLSLPLRPDRIGFSDKWRSWVELAEGEIEVIIRYDHDCVGIIEKDFKYIIGERYGLRKLHEYHNECARLARGHIQVCADDCEMLTKGWDKIIEEHMEDGPCVVQMGDKVSYPCVSRDWLDIFGSLCCHTVDAWVHFVCQGLCEKKAPILVKQYMDDNADDERNICNRLIGESFRNSSFEVNQYRAVLRPFCEGIE